MCAPKASPRSFTAKSDPEPPRSQYLPRFSAHAHNLAMLVLVGAYLSQDHPSSSLNAFWVVTYALIVRMLLFRGVFSDLNLRTIFHSIRHVFGETVQRLPSKESLSCIRSSLSMRIFCGATQAGADTSAQRKLVLADENHCFLPRKMIAALSLQDLEAIFQYCCGLSSASTPRTEASTIVNREIDRAMQNSLGDGIEVIPSTHENISALYFVAAMRVFAEWRTLRLVPDGYSKYRFGMNMAHKDLIQNLSKIEKATHMWLLHHEVAHATLADFTGGAPATTSPSLQDVLKYEVENGLHPRLPRLRDASGCSGLLWTKRQLHYQSTIFRNTLSVPLLFESSSTAAMAAYKLVYEKHHGFIVSNIFKSSFQAAPPAAVLLQGMASVDTAPSLCSSACSSGSEDEDEVWVHISVESDEYDSNEPKNVEEKNPLHAFGDSIGTQLGRLHRFIVQCGGRNMETHSSRNVMSSTSCVMLAGADPHMDVAKQAEIAKELSSFLRTVSSVLESLDLLVETFNIDDPTRV